MLSITLSSPTDVHEISFCLATFSGSDLLKDSVKCFHLSDVMVFGRVTRSLRSAVRSPLAAAMMDLSN